MISAPSSPSSATASFHLTPAGPGEDQFQRLAVLGFHVMNGTEK